MNQYSVKIANYEILIEACKQNNLKVIRYLKESGVNIFFDSDILVSYAALYNAEDVIKYLIQNGANVNTYEEDALFCAVEKGFLNIVKILVDNGSSLKNPHLIGVAETHGHTNIAEYLKSEKEKREI